MTASHQAAATGEQEYPATAGRAQRPIYCFSHIQKAAGTSVEAIMRRHFGVRHMVVNPPRGWIYRSHDLAADVRLNPLAASISSHWLRPFVDFDDWEERLVWYTFLREPIARVLSHYQYHVERMGVTRPLRAWLDDPLQQNWQTRFLAGEPDVGAAKQILAGRYAAVGLTERFDESMVLVRRLLGIARLRLWYGKPHNVAVSSARKEQVRREYEEIRDDVRERNRLDLELYDFAVRELYPRQVSAFGGAEALGEAVVRIKAEQPRASDRLRELTFLAFRRGVHLPVQRLRHGAAVRRNDPDERR